MAKRLDGKICLISGSSGMAAATATLAAAEGAQLFITGIDAVTGGELVERIRGAGGVCEFHQADLTDAKAVEQAVDRCLEVFPRIDALFNVVGMSGRRYGDGPLHQCTDEGWDATLNVNLRTMFLLSRRVLNQMLSQPVAQNGLRGTILNMGSVVAFSPKPDHFAAHAYAAAKGAIASMSLGMAAYYAAHKIRVNVIAPGLVRTPMSHRAQGSQEILDYTENQLQRLAGGMLEADEIARASLFLLSDESRHVTGEIFKIDGGWGVS